MREFLPGDLAVMYRVCLLTGDAGEDATGLYRDGDLLGHVYVGPYPAFDPALSFVVEDDEGVAGYLVGTADTIAFERWAEMHWWPPLRERYPRLPGDGPRDRWILDHIHTPPLVVPPPGHPAHLHIDLLPRLQRQGWGRRLIDAFRAALAERDVPGLYLEVDGRNAKAKAFYARLGFVPDEQGRLLLAVNPRPPRWRA